MNVSMQFHGLTLKLAKLRGKIKVRTAIHVSKRYEHPVYGKQHMLQAMYNCTY